MSSVERRRGRARWIGVGPAVAAAVAVVLSGCGAGTGAAPSPSWLAPAPSPVALLACPAAPGPVPTAGALPDVVLPCLGPGPSVRLAALTGMPTLVNVWGSWCPPCRDEIPLLNDVAAAGAGRLRVLGVGHREPSLAYAREAAANLGLRYPSAYAADADALARLRIPGAPVTLAVAADGRVVGTHIGAFANAAELSRFVTDTLDLAV